LGGKLASHTSNDEDEFLGAHNGIISNSKPIKDTLNARGEGILPDTDMVGVTRFAALGGKAWSNGTATGSKVVYGHSSADMEVALAYATKQLSLSPGPLDVWGARAA
jgi:hypothetical protein